MKKLVLTEKKISHLKSLIYKARNDHHKSNRNPLLIKHIDDLYNKIYAYIDQNTEEETREG